uniref:Odorant receptor n=1 Tax=Yemma signatus TaxID=300820 RepID=A0A385H5D3_9HEMI|nr:odorant receptor [Yemma signatus]
MDFFHHIVLKTSLKYTGDEELRLFTVHKAAFQFLGFDWWDEEGDGQSKGGIRHFITRVLHPIVYMSGIFSASVLTAHRCLDLDTSTAYGYNIFMNNIIVVFAYMYSFTKVVYLHLFYGKNAKKLIRMLEDLGELKRGRKAWEDSLKGFSYYMFLLSWIVSMWSIYFLVKYNNFSYMTSYPWNQETSIGFTAAFECNLLVSSYVCVVHTAVDSLIAVCCGIMIGHVEELIDILKTIGQPGTDDMKALKEAINLHVRVKNAADEMNNSYSLLFAVQPIYTTLHACVIIFTFVEAEDKVASLLSTSPMLMASYVQLFLYCFFSQKLTSKCEELTFASYNNNWYCSSMEVKKGLLLFSVATQRTVALRGLGQRIASFECLQNTIQESYSAYIILNSMAKDV